MPRHCRLGPAGFRPSATKPRRSRTSGSAGWGNSLLRGARYVFLDEHHVVWHIQLAKHVHALPHMTRDYIAARERERLQPALRVVGE
jgi:hypothetical protein